jgi:hypothetical protein
VGDRNDYARVFDGRLEFSSASFFAFPNKTSTKNFQRKMQRLQDLQGGALSVAES